MLYKSNSYIWHFKMTLIAIYKTQYLTLVTSLMLIRDEMSASRTSARQSRTSRLYIKVDSRTHSIVGLFNSRPQCNALKQNLKNAQLHQLVCCLARSLKARSLRQQLLNILQSCAKILGKCIFSRLSQLYVNWSLPLPPISMLKIVILCCTCSVMS